MRIFDYWDNGIIKIKPYPGISSCRGQMKSVISFWLRDCPLSNLEAEILNRALLYNSGGGTDFHIDTISLVEDSYGSPNEIWSAFNSLCERGICETSVLEYHKCRSYDFAITNDNLFDIEDEMSGRKKKNPLDRSGCYVYIFYNEYHFKVGISKNPERRRKQLQTSSSHPIQSIFEIHTERWLASKIERDVHKKFADKRMMGEWFDVPHNDLKVAVLRSHSFFVGENK